MFYLRPFLLQMRVMKSVRRYLAGKRRPYKTKHMSPEKEDEIGKRRKVNIYTNYLYWSIETHRYNGRSKEIVNRRTKRKCERRARANTLFEKQARANKQLEKQARANKK